MVAERQKARPEAALDRRLFRAGQSGFQCLDVHGPSRMPPLDGNAEEGWQYEQRRRFIREPTAVGTPTVAVTAGLVRGARSSQRGVASTSAVRVVVIDCAEIEAPSPTERRAAPGRQAISRR